LCQEKSGNPALHRESNRAKVGQKKSFNFFNHEKEIKKKKKETSSEIKTCRLLHFMIFLPLLFQNVDSPPTFLPTKKDLKFMYSNAATLKAVSTVHPTARKMSTYRVTGRVCKKGAQYVAQPIFSRNEYLIYTMGKK
jgi:hypothetical protein